MRGYFGIGIDGAKNTLNMGTLWRSAHIFGASFIFTIGHRYKRQPSDTTKAFKHIPYFAFQSFEDFYKMMPHDCRLIGVELTETAVAIKSYCHPERAIYLLGAEDNGLSKIALEKCHDIVILPGSMCMNVAVAGSIVMFDRVNKILS